MVRIKEFLKLVRWQNLLIVAATMFLMRYMICGQIVGLLPYIPESTGKPEVMLLSLSLLDFVILVLSTVFITAAGYVINDYFDIRTDLVNRGKVLVGTRIARRKAMMWHNILNITGISGGFYVSYKIGFFWLGIFFMLVSGLLYFYSASYKRQFLVGNLVVSFLTAMVPFMVVVYEAAAIHLHYYDLAVNMPALSVMFYWVGGFAVFAFISTLLREIVKDMEDFEGDKAYGSRSLPVVAGIKTSRFVVLSLAAVLLLMLLFVWYFHLRDSITLIYILAVLVVPLALSQFYVIRNRSQADLHRASNWLKILMLGGICYSLVVFYIVKTSTGV